MGLLSSAFGLFSTSKSQRRQAALEYSYGLQNARELPSAQVQGYRDAGINPMSVFGNLGGASISVGGGTASGDFNINDYLQAGASAQAAEAKSKEIKSVEATTKNTEATTKNTETNTSVTEATKPFIIEKAKADAATAKANEQQVKMATRKIQQEVNKGLGEEKVRKEWPVLSYIIDKAMEITGTVGGVMRGRSSAKSLPSKSIIVDRDTGEIFSH